MNAIDFILFAMIIAILICCVASIMIDISEINPKRFEAIEFGSDYWQF